MKEKGVRIDTQKLESLGEKLRFRRDNLLNIVKKHTGITLQLWAANSIKDLLNNQSDKNKKTYWIFRDKIKRSMKKQF